MPCYNIKISILSSWINQSSGKLLEKQVFNFKNRYFLGTLIFEILQYINSLHTCDILTYLFNSCAVGDIFLKNLRYR